MKRFSFLLFIAVGCAMCDSDRADQLEVDLSIFYAERQKKMFVAVDITNKGRMDLYIPNTFNLIIMKQDSVGLYTDFTSDYLSSELVITDAEDE